MLRFAAVLALLSVSLAMAAPIEDKPAYCHNLDCPTFTITQKDEAHNFEVRSYQKAKWVRTLVNSTDFVEASNTGFRRLFKYISGANKQGVKIEMTTPVTTKVTPGDGPVCESGFEVSFFVPLKFQSDPPAPTESDVYVEEADQVTVGVVSFPGWVSSYSVVQKQAQALSALMSDIPHREDVYLVAQYDSPFTIFNRHNEVWFLVNSQ